MSVRFESGDCVYQELANWARLPEGLILSQVADVAVGAQDRVYVFDRGEHPIIVFEPDGTFVTAWKQGLFARPHGVTVGPDGALYCVDDGEHCIRKCSPDGQVLATIGTPGEPSPFDRPTKVAFHPQTGNLYIADGYGNARVHAYTAGGRHLVSWGTRGTEPGQFSLVHSIAIDGEGRVYIADRENHRVQIFDERGRYLDQWTDLHRPCALHIRGDLVYIGQVSDLPGTDAGRSGSGACVTIHDLAGRRLARLGGAHPGQGSGPFIAPHGLAVDSRGDLYVGDSLPYTCRVSGEE